MTKPMMTQEQDLSQNNQAREGTEEVNRGPHSDIAKVSDFSFLWERLK